MSLESNARADNECRETFIKEADFAVMALEAAIAKREEIGLVE